jgi:hypothetical protein
MPKVKEIQKFVVVKNYLDFKLSFDCTRDDEMFFKFTFEFNKALTSIYNVV